MDWRPLMAISLKSFSKAIFLIFGFGLRVTLMTSASPFGFTVKYTMREPGFPCVTSYSLSRVMDVMLNRLM